VVSEGFAMGSSAGISDVFDAKSEDDENKHKNKNYPAKAP